MRLFLSIIAVSTLIVMGCGEKDVRNVHLSGTVTYDGKPVPFGNIVFTPDSSAGNTGPQGMAVIENGQYDTSKEGGKAVIGGAYVVNITGSTAKPDPTVTDGKGTKPLFKPFETKVDLPKKTGTMDFTVK